MPDNPLQSIVKEAKIYFEQLKDLGEEELYVLPKSKAVEEMEEEGETVKEKKPDEIRTLDELNEKYAGCTRCALSENRERIVFGEGNPDAKLMLIGEAPGAEEDSTGRPFVGRAGKLLDKILAAVDLSREEVFITSILKCRPPENRDPKSEEVEACHPILMKQIEIIQPKIILALGRWAGQTLLGSNSSLGDMRGKIHDFHGIELLVTYHPAALLRNRNWKKPTWEDVQMMKAEYDKL